MTSTILCNIFQTLAYWTSQILNDELLGLLYKSDGAVFPWTLSSPVNNGEPAFTYGLPSPESHQAAGTTQSVFTPHTSPSKHCCLLIEHQQRTNGRWCSWDLGTSAPLRVFFPQHALIEWFQWSQRVCLSPRGYYQSVCQPRLQSGSRGMSSSLIAGTGVWSAAESPSVHLSRVSADPFLKNNHSLSSEEVPELIINKCWMLGGRGASYGECRELSRGGRGRWGWGSVLLECSGWWSIRWAVKVDLTPGQRTDRCLGVQPNTDKRTPSGKASPVKQKKRGRVKRRSETEWDKQACGTKKLANMLSEAEQEA